MHAQTQATPAQPEATPYRALAAMLLATDRTKEERRKLDDHFPQAKTADSHKAWKVIARGVKKLHEQTCYNGGKVGDDQGVVGDAYRKASRASHRDSGASAQFAAHVAIETIAKSFVTDGTYANYAVNPDGIANIAALVGELQHQSRGLNRALGLGGLAIDQVFFNKDNRSEWDEALAAAREAKARYDALSDNYYGRIREARKAMPAELIKPSGWYGFVCRWRSMDDLNEDDMLSHEEKARLAPTLTTWLASQKTHEQGLDTDDTDDALNASHDAWIEAESRLVDLKAPDVAAEADRLELIGHMNEYGPIDLSDEAGLMTEAQTFAGRCALNASFAILRSAGRPVPVLEDFDARGWIKAYEAQGGIVSCGLWDYLILVSAPGNVEVDEMRSDLYAHPARAEVVYSLLKERVTEGGDKLYRSGWYLCGTMPSVPFDRVDIWRENGEWKVNVTTFNNQANSDPVAIAAE